MAKYLLGIDIGTTSTKVLVIKNNGEMIADMSLSSTLASLNTGWAEEDPIQWWQNITKVVPEILLKAAIKPKQIAGIGVSGMVPTLILLDESGMVLRPSIQQNDARAIEEIKFQQNRTDENDILNRTGSAITAQSIGPKLLWVKKHEPSLFKRARHLLGSYDYIVYRLTNQFSSERNWALESGLYNLQMDDWDETLLSLAEIDRNWLGILHNPSDFVGGVTAGAADACGLAEGTPVFAGSADHIASAFSAGVNREGDLLIKLGGAGDILYCTNDADMDPRLYLDFHIIPGKFLINGCMASSGSLIRWFCEQCTPSEDYADLDQKAESIPAGSNGLILLPYFVGEKTPINDPLARGTWIGLTLSHTKAHMYRSILEGIAFGFNHHIQVLMQKNHEINRIRVTNGGAHSILWRQIVTDVIGLPLEYVAHHPGSSLGAAFVAGKGTGVFQSWDEIERFINIADISQPDMGNHARYKHFFEIYVETYRALQALYPRLTEI
ncbi:MAG TPA: carbohydrate kinase [Anaerolineaceae bacterium]|nr:carbohydrate kinase [Anaerolineaceae bacterium]